MEMKYKTIGDTEYGVEPMDGEKGLKTQTKLVKLLGGGLPAIVKGFTEVSEIKERDKKTTAIVDLISPLLGSMDDKEVSDFVLSLFKKKVFIIKNHEDKKINTTLDFKKHFAGKSTQIWEVAAFILQVNFFSMGE